MAVWKKETFEYYDTRIAAVQQEKLELQRKVGEKETEEQSLLKKRCDFGIKKYASIKIRESIISEAENCGYSPKAINKLKEYNKFPWNQDNITNEIINDFTDAFNFIRKQNRYRESLLYKIGDIFGGNEDED